MSYEQTEREAIEAAETHMRPPDEPYPAWDDGSPDITIKVDDEHAVGMAEAQTDAGEDFIDAFTAAELVAVDVGRIIIPEAEVVAFMDAAEASGLRVEEVQ